MTDKKITQLSNAAALTGSELIELVQSGNNVQSTTQAIATLGSSATVSALSVFGDGSDGTINFDGTTTVLGLAPSSGVYTLSRDIYLATGSQISGTGTIKTNGFRVFCRGTFTIGASRNINNDGNAASGTTGGTAPLNVSNGCTYANNGGAGSGAGQNGNANANGGNGQPVANAMGGQGGQGGSSAGGPGTGGGTATGGVVTAPLVSHGTIRNLFSAISGMSPLLTNSYMGGSGGASGDAGATSTGGGGGAGGYPLLLCAQAIVNNGTISSQGGAGGSATGSNAGGGAGGGGGLVVLVYNSFTGNAATVAGGTGGAAVGTGKNGGAGATGTIVSLVNA